MFETISVALNLHDRELLRQITSHLAELGGTKIVGSSTNDSLPPADAQVVVVEDPPTGLDVLDKLHKLREHLSGAAVFVVSGRSEPEHIVEVMQAGAVEYFLTPMSPQKLLVALDKVRGLLSDLTASAKGSVYSFISSKGGLGATVLAVNTAAAMALRGAGSVALVDNSLQSGDSSVLLDLIPERTIEDICRHFHRLDASFLRGAMVTHSSGLHFLAAPAAPEDSGGIRSEHLSRVLDLAKEVYSQTVVDCQSMSVDQYSVEAFKASDKIFIITDMSVPAVRNATRLIQLIHKLRINPHKVEVVVNRFIRGGGGPPVSEIEKTLGRRVFWLFPNNFGDVIASINQGIPLVKAHPGNVFSKNVNEFVDRLLHLPSPEAYRGVKGLLGRPV